MKFTLVICASVLIVFGSASCAQAQRQLPNRPEPSGGRTSGRDPGPPQDQGHTPSRSEPQPKPETAQEDGESAAQPETTAPGPKDQEDASDGEQAPTPVDEGMAGEDKNVRHQMGKEAENSAGGQASGGEDRTPGSGRPKEKDGSGGRGSGRSGRK